MVKVLVIFEEWFSMTAYYYAEYLTKNMATVQPCQKCKCNDLQTTGNCHDITMLFMLWLYS